MLELSARTHKQAHQEPARKESGLILHEELTSCPYRPDDDLNRNPAIRAKPFADQLRRYLGDDEANTVHVLGIVVVVGITSACQSD